MVVVVVVVEVEVVVVVQSPHVYGQKVCICVDIPQNDANVVVQSAPPSMHACPDAYGISLRHIKIKSLNINIMT